MKYQKVRAIGLSFLSICFLVPIGIYILTFGYHISSDPKDWADMGSAMSGIYSPILTLFTLVILFRQLQIQDAAHIHTIAYAFVQQARADLHYYLDQLVDLLQEPGDGRALIGCLGCYFECATEAELKSPDLKNIAVDLNVSHPRLLPVWMEINNILTGLRAGGQLYELEFESSKLKVSAMVAFPTSVALDHLLYTVSEPGTRKYEFSPLLAIIKPA